MFSILVHVLLGSYIVLENVFASSSTSSWIIPDITEPIHAFKNGKITKESFLTTIFSGQCSNSTGRALFYHLDTDLTHDHDGPHSIKAAVNQIWNVSRILNETMATVSTVQLITYFPAVLELLNDAMDSIAWEDIYHFPNIELLIAVEPHGFSTENRIEMFSLSVFRQMFGVSRNQNIRLGFASFNGYFPGLNNFETNLYKTDITFVIYTTTFENPLQIDGYFIEFQTRVTSKNAFSKLEIFYWPKFMFINYTKINGFELQRVYGDVTGGNIILEISNAENQMKNHNAFTIIPHLNAEQITEEFYGQHFSMTALLLLALEASNKGFNTVLLNHRQWQLLKHSISIDVFMAKVTTPSLRVILDYSEEASKDIPGFELEWKNTDTFWAHLDVIKVEAVVFGLKYDDSNDYELNTGNLKTQFTDLPTKPKIVCSIGKESFVNINATKIVKSCKTIGGNVYILKWQVTFKWEEDYNKYNSLPNSYLRYMAALEPTRHLRDKILNLHQGAIVYLQIDVIGVDRFVRLGNSTVPLQKDVLSYSLFCQPALTDINKMFVAIITWANGYNFPIILNSALSHKTSFQIGDEQWLSFLRKVPHDNRNIEHKPNCSTGRGAGFPITGNEYYNTESCVDLIERRPEITLEYFNNTYVGVVFHTDDIQFNETAFGDALNTMLRFVLHGFRLIEIVTSSNFPEVITTIASVIKLDSTPDMNSELFINYVATENETEVELTKFAKFLDQLENSGMTMVKGIHIDIPKYSKSGSLLSEREHQPLQSLFRDKLKGKEFSPKLGILVYVQKLHDDNFIQYLTTKAKTDDDDIQAVFLNQVDYIVCYLKLDFQTVEMDKENLQLVFNNNLYWKRIIQYLFPHLEIYFRIEVDIETNSDSEILKKYLAFLSQVKTFSLAYNLSYFVVEAFDNGDTRKNGWWGIKSGGDPAKPQSFYEKEAALSGRYMWFPAPVVEQSEATKAFLTSQWFVFGISVPSVLLLISVVVGSVFVVRYRSLRQQLSDEDINDFLNGRPAGNDLNDVFTAETMKFDSKHELQMQDIIVDTTTILGVGNFGTVLKGEVKGNPAAIKQPKKDCPKGTFKSVLTEIKVLCYIGVHPNVVGFIGAYTKEIRQRIIFIATELCSNGSLEKLLRKKKSVISEQDAGRYQPSQLENLLYFSDLRRFAKEIASGMDFIESKNVVHGDLAARNILLDVNLTCKIGDFGLSRKLYEYQIYVKKSQEPIPWKWMALESLTKMEFTCKSDVWSFGITLWEIFSLGEVPYGGLNWTREFADELRNGFRLPIAQFSSEIIHENLMKCWDLNPEERPTFADLVVFFTHYRDTSHVAIGDSEYVN